MVNSHNSDESKHKDWDSKSEHGGAVFALCEQLLSTGMSEDREKFWKEKDLIKQQIKMWELNDIETFIVDLSNTERLIKKNPQISNQIINNMILDKFKDTSIQI